MKSKHKQATTRPSANERGSALVLVLGVLSLLLISATVFIFTANTEREAAAVGADVTKARLMAKGKMELAVAYLYYAATNAAGNGSMYPGTSIMGAGAAGSDWENIYHAASAWSPTYADDLGDAFHVDYGFDYTPATNTSDMNGSPSWQLIIDDKGDADSTNDELVGRATYVIIDESGKLNPNFLINPTEPFFDEDDSGSQNGTEYYQDWDGGGFTSTPINEGSEARYGYSPSEIDIAGGIKTHLGITSLFSDANRFESKRNPNSTPKMKKWLSWTQMYKADYNGKLFDGTDDDELKSLKNVLFPCGFDKEAYRHTDGVDYQRFSVGTFDWSTATVAGLQTATAAVWTKAGAESTSIPWLAALVASYDGADADTNPDIPDADLKNQVAANLIDYCDTDNNATHNYGSGNTYCGLEKVPYINEVAISFRYVISDGIDGISGTGDDIGTLTIFGYVEMVNIYGEDLSFNDNEVSLDVTGYFDDNVGPVESVLNLTAAGNPVTLGPISGSGDYYHVVPMTPVTITLDAATLGWGPVSSFDNIQIRNVEAVFKSAAGDVRDFSVISKDTNTVASLGDGGVAYAAAETEDPRCNTVDAMWSWDPNSAAALSTTDFSSGTGTLAVSGASYLGAKNTNANPSSGDDTEIATDPAAGISTAFIRNAPMLSLWELGAIHRGEPWRTINLTKYNDTTATVGSYGYGDAILLDQCCVGPEKYADGRFNVNSPLADAWYALLYGIKVGTGYGHSTPATGALLDSTQITAAKLAAIVATTNGNAAFTSRGQIAEIAELQALDTLQTDSTTATNALQEEIIGKIANLLTTRTNYFTILVTAQVVKDLGTVPDPIPAGDRPSSWSQLDTSPSQWVDILAEVKQIAVVYRDAHTNEFKIENIQTLE